MHLWLEGEFVLSEIAGIFYSRETMKNNKMNLSQCQVYAERGKKSQNRTRRVKFFGRIGILFLLLMVLCGHAFAQRISWAGSLNYSTGSYFFTDPVNSFNISNGISISGDRFSASTSIPYIIQNTPWISYAGSGPTPTGGPQSGSVNEGRKGGGQMGGRRNHIDIPDSVRYSQTGFGDPWLHASISLLEPGRFTSLRITSGLKIPLASPDRGFGTGAWDTSAGLSVTQRINKTLIFADASYWWLGDMSDLNLNNSLSYSIGAGYSFYPSNWMITTSFQGTTPVLDDYDPPASVNAGLGYMFSDKASLSSFFSVGLSESAPDFTIGFGWAVKL